MTTFRKRYSLTFWPHPLGRGCVCGQNICYHVAASIVSFNLISNMTTFRKIYSLTPPPGSRVCLIREKMSKFSQLSFCQKLFFLNHTPSCICSMCLHCIGKVSNCSIKSCCRSWSAHEGTIYAYTKALLGENCLSSHSCHFVKNYFFWSKLLHAYVQCVYIV